MCTLTTRVRHMLLMDQDHSAAARQRCRSSGHQRAELWSFGLLGPLLSMRGALHPPTAQTLSMKTQLANRIASGTLEYDGNLRSYFSIDS